jgi:uncharacterized protein YoxC
MSKEKALKLINEYLAKQEVKKEELSTEKISLGIASDSISDMFKAIEKTYRNGENLVDEFENNKKRAQRQISSIEKSYSKASKIYKDTTTDLQRKAKELDIPANSIPDFDKLVSRINFIERKKNEIISNLKKYI